MVPFQPLRYEQVLSRRLVGVTRRVFPLWNDHGHVTQDG